MATLDLYPAHEGERFTLRGIFREEVDAWRKAEKLRREELNVYAFAEDGPSGQELFFVAGRHDVEPDPRASIPHKSTPSWDAVRVAVQVFRSILRAAKRKGYEVRWYKPLEEERIRECVERWHWQGTKKEVAADIVSKTLQTHPFPNANHRVALTLGRLYLNAVGISWPAYSLRGRGIDRFHRDTRDFVAGSKYLLHLIRHQAMVRIAHEEGFNEVRLKDGSTVEIQPPELSATRKELKDKHTRSAERLISDLAADDVQEKLEEANEIGLSEWVSIQQG